jgi:flagellar biosynthesis/type III secretory pathway protein FliH
MISNELLNQLQELTQSADLSPAFESAIHNLMVSARKEGYDDGYERGYDDGDDDGYNRGTIDGKNDGINLVRSGILGD